MSHNSNFSKDSAWDSWGYVKYISGLKFYRNDVRVSYAMRGNRKKPKKVKRGEIVEFTQDSRNRLAFVANNTPVTFEWMVTLTYPSEFETDGKTVKAHLNKFLTWMRKAKPGVQYLWFLEFQRRGAPHFHILLDMPLDRQKVSERWFDHVNSGDVKHIRAGTNVERIRKPDGARRYAVKYSMKMKQKKVPKAYRNVGRFWGNSRGVNPDVQMEIDDLSVSRKELTQALNFWDHVGAIEKRPLSTLYGASGNAYEILTGIGASHE